MNDNTNTHPTPGRNLPQTPAELRSIEASLDELGAEERSAAPEALEDRIYLASRASLGAGDAAPVIARIGGQGGRFGAPARIAAGLAIVVGAGALIGWLALTPPPVAPHDSAVAIEAAAIDEEFETWLAAASVWDDIDVFITFDVESDMAALSDEIASPWFALEDPLLSEELF
ncbi:MAG: hypothetical protein EA376_07710 [Phycisphaeraceae bacterium]|nr:MAG: hypothetical protein EA376_07710 [Phycisphaeraceae bacterium]